MSDEPKPWAKRYPWARMTHRQLVDVVESYRVNFENEVIVRRQTQIESEELRAEIERLRAENYDDLLAQMEEAWGKGDWRGLCREELTAFLHSRRVHRPTTLLRAEVERLREENGRLRTALSNAQQEIARIEDDHERLTLKGVNND